MHPVAPALKPAEPSPDPLEFAVAADNQLLVPFAQLAEWFVRGNPPALAEFHQPPGSAWLGD
ncbi:MAG TPA: hypothetical protein VFM35_11805, partial [Candidatus Binatia bacterium]|nr:hypothetical protein [Candidatus Binatia bacterium]